MNTDLTGLGLEYEALYADDVADVQFLKSVVGFLTQVISGGIDLDRAVSVLDVSEGCLAHLALEHHTAGNGHVLAFQFLEVLSDLGSMMGLVVGRYDKRIFALRLEARKLLTAYLHQLVDILLRCVLLLIVLLLVGVLLILICHWISFLSFRQMTGCPSI